MREIDWTERQRYFRNSLRESVRGRNGLVNMIREQEYRNGGPIKNPRLYRLYSFMAKFWTRAIRYERAVLSAIAMRSDVHYRVLVPKNRVQRLIVMVRAYFLGHL